MSDWMMYLAHAKEDPFICLFVCLFDVTYFVTM